MAVKCAFLGLIKHAEVVCLRLLMAKNCFTFDLMQSKQNKSVGLVIKIAGEFFKCCKILIG